MKQTLSVLGWLVVAIAGTLALALLPALPLLAYLYAFGVATTSALLFAEAIVDVTCSLIPLAMVLRAKSVAAVAAAELVVGLIGAALVTLLLPALVGSAAAAAIPAWWIAMLTARRACTAVSSRLTLERKELSGGWAIMAIVAAALKVIVTLATASLTAVIVVSTVLQAVIVVFAAGAARRRPVSAEYAATAPRKWGTWLSNVLEDVPLPLAVVWFGSVALAAPLIATSYVTILCWIALAGVLSSEKIERPVRMIVAAAFVPVFWLLAHHAAPGLYGLLFPSLAVHSEWFDALAWLGILLLAVPLPRTWQLPRSEVSRGATALLGLAIVVLAGQIGGLPGLVLGAAVARALQWRPDEPAPKQ